MCFICYCCSTYSVKSNRIQLPRYSLFRFLFFSLLCTDQWHLLMRSKSLCSVSWCFEQHHGGVSKTMCAQWRQYISSHFNQSTSVHLSVEPIISRCVFTFFKTTFAFHFRVRCVNTFFVSSFCVSIKLRVFFFLLEMSRRKSVFELTNVQQVQLREQEEPLSNEIDQNLRTLALLRPLSDAAKPLLVKVTHIICCCCFFFLHYLLCESISLFFVKFQIFSFNLCISSAICIKSMTFQNENKPKKKISRHFFSFLFAFAECISEGEQIGISSSFLLFGEFDNWCNGIS